MGPSANERQVKKPAASVSRDGSGAERAETNNTSFAKTKPENRRKTPNGDRDEKSRDSQNVSANGAVGSQQPQAPVKNEPSLKDESQSVKVDVRAGAPSGIGKLIEKADAQGEGERKVSGSTEMTLAGLVDAIARKADLNSKGPKIDSETLSLLESFKGEQVTVKQLGVQQFMARMKEAFDIDPEEIVQAFTKLDQKTLLSSPEQAKDAFLNNLDVDGEDMSLAGEMYDQMVEITGRAEMNEKFANLEGVKFEVLSPKDASAKRLNDGLNRMNDSFFAPSQRQLKAQPMSGEDMNAQIARLQQERGLEQPKNSLQASALAEAALAAQKSPVADDVADDSSRDGFDEVEGLSALGSKESSAAKLSSSLEGMTVAQASSSFDGGMNQQNGQGSSDLSGSQGKNFMGQVKKSQAAETAKTGGKSFAAETGEAKNDSEASSANDSSAFSNVSGSQMSLDKRPLVGSPAAMIVDPKATDKDQAVNVRELIKQAQVMLRRGGGEMKIEMSPEGMGQIHLKVAVENGHVNLQMITESDAAKKMLENGLHELKAGLAAHKLHVERAQIEIGNEIQKQLDQQSQQEQARQQARQSAMDFMGNFRENNEGFRQAFAGDPFGNGRGYGRPERRSPINPEPVVSSAGARRSDDGRRLNLVA
jgi:flagellar hook-length control protein FliK